MATTKQSRKPAARKTSAKKATTKTSSNKVEAAVNEAIEDVKQEATSILETLKTNVSKLQDNAQQTWLVGLGAVGKSVDQARDRYTSISEESQELIQDLIARGEIVQEQAEVRFNENRANIEEQIEAARTRMTEIVSVIDIPGRLQDISDRLESLGKDLKKSA